MRGWLKRKGQRHVTAQIIGGVLRAALALVGGVGLVSENDIEQFSGAVAVALTLVWTTWQKIQAAREKEREKAAVVASALKSIGGA